MHRELVVKAADGVTILQRSRNLGGIRSIVGKYVIEGISIRKAHSTPGVDAFLDIHFADKSAYAQQTNGKFAGASFHADFASFGVLRQFVRRWRSVYGAPLYVNGESCGDVSYDNPALNK